MEWEAEVAGFRQEEERKVSGGGRAKAFIVMETRLV